MAFHSGAPRSPVPFPPNRPSPWQPGYGGASFFPTRPTPVTEKPPCENESFSPSGLWSHILITHFFRGQIVFWDGRLFGTAKVRLWAAPFGVSLPFAVRGPTLGSVFFCFTPEVSAASVEGIGVLDFMAPET